MFSIAVALAIALCRAGTGQPDPLPSARAPHLSPFAASCSLPRASPQEGSTGVPPTLQQSAEIREQGVAARTAAVLAQPQLLPSKEVSL